MTLVRFLLDRYGEGVQTSYDHDFKLEVETIPQIGDDLRIHSNVVPGLGKEVPRRVYKRRQELTDDGEQFVVYADDAILVMQRDRERRRRTEALRKAPEKP